MNSRTTAANGAMSQPPFRHLSGTLTPRAPFDFTQTLAFMRIFTPMSGEQRIADDSLTKAVALDGRAVVFNVRSEGAVEQPLLTYTLTSAEPLSETEQAALRDRITFFLSLDDDLRPFYAHASEDPMMAPMVARRYGLHQPRFLTPFECACWAILAQRMPLAMARRVKDRLVARYGPQIVVDGVAWRAFPEAATLASADATELSAIVRNERKVEYLSAVIQLFCAVDEAWLRAGPLDEVVARLRATRGIGAWSAAFILIRGLGRMEYALAPDEELSRAAGRLYNAGQPLAPAEITRLLERYGETRGYWAFYCRNALTNDGRHAEE